MEENKFGGMKGKGKKRWKIHCKKWERISKGIMIAFRAEAKDEKEDEKERG